MRHPALLSARLAVLLLIVMGPANQLLGSVRWDVVGSPTEVLNTGRSEVLGSINLFVRGTGNITGTSTGGAVQIGLTFAEPDLQIDNSTDSGIRLYFSSGLSAARPSIVGLGNGDFGGRCAGFLTMNLQPGAHLSENDFLRIEGIRGRIDASNAVIPGTNLYVALQSANDPSANSFSLDRLRIATSLKGLNAEVISSSSRFEIRIIEGFSRAFVDFDSGDDGANVNDRTDSGGSTLGAPTNSTQIQIRLNNIPDGVADVAWPVTTDPAVTGSFLILVHRSFSSSESTAIYSYETLNQVGRSDLVTEAFSVVPGFVFGSGHCNTDRLTASVTLAPAWPEPSGCEPPSNNSARPRFLESYELTIQSISTASVTAGSEGFTIQVLGSGFLATSALLWNGSPRRTSFISAAEISAVIPASDLARPTTASLAVMNPPAGGGNVSNMVQFLITPMPLTLAYPGLTSGGSAPRDSANRDFIGIALVNLSGRQAKLKFTAFDRNGLVILGRDLTNPATLILPDAYQSSMLVTEVFGSGIDNAAPVGWVRVEASVPQITGFFLSFDGRLTRMDGADVSTDLMTSFVLPEIQDQGTTLIHIANPNDASTALTLELIKADGTPRVPAVRRTVFPNGALSELVGDLFPGMVPDASDYIRAISERGVTAFEYLTGTARDTAGVNGQDEVAGGAVLYCPQYVVGGRDWSSFLSIVNRSTRAGIVSLRFVPDDGSPAEEARVLQIPAQGKLRITDPGFLAAAGDKLKQGYLEISTDGIRISGSVVFANPSLKTSYAALPLVASLKDRMIFSHIASNSTFFTGLALLNPDDQQAPAVIQVFDSTGKVLASRTEIIAPRSRVSKLLTEYFPHLGGMEIDSGYISVTGMRNLAAFALFGTRDLAVLSAIPAQTIR